MARTEVRRVACVPTPLAVAAATFGDGKRSQAERSLPTHVDLTNTDFTQRRPLSAPAHWPSKMRRIMNLLNDPHARAKVEPTHRAHWVMELRELVIAAQLPVAELAAQTQDPSALFNVLAADRRARTIRRRVLDWKQAGLFFTVLSGMPWPASHTQFMDCLQCVAYSGAGRSALGRAVHALVFTERVGHLPSELRISQMRW